MALTRTGRLRPVDLLLLGWVALTTLVAVLRLASRPATGWVLLLNLLIATLILLLARPDAGGVGRALREWYPLLLLPALYGSLDLLNGLGLGRVYDPEVLAAERWIFGGEPARTWWQRYPSAFWSTLLHGAYWSYYLILAVPVAWFVITRRAGALRHTVLLLTATFVLCYTVFLFFPVAGPYYWYPRPDAAFLDNAMARLVYGTLATGSSHGAAFPSSHVAAAVVATVGAWRGSRLAGGLLLPATLLMIVSVVYCQMHYAVDALAGLAVALGVTVVSRGGSPREGARHRAG